MTFCEGALGYKEVTENCAEDTLAVEKAVALSFTMMFLNFALREMQFLPAVMPDEAAWIALLEQRASGLAPSISGPLFAWLVAAVSDIGGLTLRSTVPAVALLSSGFAVITTFFIYRRSLGSHSLALASVIMLTTTSYFVGPSFEARPQQVATIMLIIICLHHFKSTHIAPTAVTFLLAPLMYWHILTFAVCTGALLIITSYRWWGGQLRYRDAMQWVVMFSLLTGLLIFSSDYEAMFLDVYANHWKLQISPAVTLFLMFLMLQIACFFAANLQLSRIRDDIAEHKPSMILTLLVALAVMLGMQIQLLPETAIFYARQNVMTLLLWHLGNAVFFIFFILGYVQLIKPRENDSFEPFLIGSTLLALIAVMALLLSIGMLHKNWAIRVLYCWILFAAPVCIVGIRHVITHFHRALIPLWCALVFSAISHLTLTKIIM